MVPARGGRAGEARSVGLVDREFLPSAERYLQRDAGTGEVRVHAPGDRTERLVQLLHRLGVGQLHAGREDGVGGRGEGQPSDRAGERPDAAHGGGVGVLDSGQGVPQVARQVLGCGFFSAASHTACVGRAWPAGRSRVLAGAPDVEARSKSSSAWDALRHLHEGCRICGTPCPPDLTCGNVRLLTVGWWRGPRRRSFRPPRTAALWTESDRRRRRTLPLRVDHDAVTTEGFLARRRHTVPGFPTVASRPPRSAGRPDDECLFPELCISRSKGVSGELTPPSRYRTRRLSMWSITADTACR